MRIKSLHIHGFKSFADRTELNFGSQIVGIVGPNGCGKSNIVDAIRWAMGEQSAKGLRGEEMADVIFNGTADRKRSGLAEVSLIFDNSDRLAPSPYTECHEIMVTRRLFRTGESEYLINKVTVRLKDVTDLFLGTGSSAKAYSIVAQGKIDQIVMAKAEDRRLLLEEAAGVAKYKARKVSAERKMEATQLNLERISDIVKELERNVRTLERQANRAEQFRKIQKELRYLDEQIMGAKATHLDQQILMTQENKTKVEKEFELASTQFSSVEAKLEKLRLNALETEKNSGSDYENLMHLKENIFQCEKDLELRRQRITLLQSQIEERKKDVQGVHSQARLQLEMKRAEYEHMLEESLQEREELSKQYSECSHTLKHMKEKQDDLEKEIAVLEADQDQSEKDHQRLLEEQRESEKKLNGCDAELRSLLALEEHAVGYKSGALARKKATGAHWLMDQLQFKSEFKEMGDAFLYEFGQCFLSEKKEKNIFSEGRWAELWVVQGETFKNNLLHYVEGTISEPLKNVLEAVEVVEALPETPQEHAQIDEEGRMRIPLSPGVFYEGNGVVKIQEAPFSRKREIEKKEKEKILLQESLLNLEKERQELSSKNSHFKKTFQRKQEELQTIQTEKVEFQMTLTRVQTRKEALEEKITQTHTEISQLENQLLEISDKLKQESLKKDSSEIQKQEQELSRQEERVQKEEGQEQIVHLEKKLAENKQKLSRLRTEIDESENERRILLSQKENLREQLQTLELQEQKFRHEVNELSQLVWERYHLELQEFVENAQAHDLKRLQDETVLNALEIEAQELREKIEKFGEVNLLALTEHKEIKQRLDFMNKQREDLLKTLDVLQQIIDRINRVTEFRFRETFKAINYNFEIIFPKLFGGGRAYMTLTDEKNLLETGVEIFAEPPGKKIQAMSLLSGGEKALTSISLLFALFAYRPASFCILDEVDAPLDEVNTARFNGIVRDMASLSQFVVITHNKKTMEMADVLFGVTMPAPGVSQMVSVHLREAQILAKSSALVG